MLICCCGEHNTPGDQVCPGDCEAARTAVIVAGVGCHVTARNVADMNGVEPLSPTPDDCLLCGEDIQ